MRKSSIFILLLIGTLLVLSPTKSDKTENYFDQWRPDTIGSGCHSDQTRNDQVSGSLLFNSSWFTVGKDQDFALAISVANFGGDVAVESENDLTIGFNLIDEDNADFIVATIANISHVIDGSGNSVDPWITTFTAPTSVGNYTLVAYAVSSDSDGADPYFEWIRGQIRIEVTEPTGPQGLKFNIELETVVANDVTFIVRPTSMNDVKTIELSVDNEPFAVQTPNPQLQNFQRYNLDLSPGVHNITVRVTNQADLITSEFIEFVVPEPITTSTQVSTTTGEPFTQSTETKTEDHGLLSSPISLGILVVVMLISVSAPLVLMRKFFT
ncbi:MAG: hypothetical protein HeimC2_27940 [Candidatus Heimdallarchaeota archaeon LC_2]|nr:MAG: hypothetical protein HeimC2_27940 [Candidatus Heimdallarchaeota archaeon LC_2]